MITTEALMEWWDQFGDDGVTAWQLAHILDVPTLFVEELECDLDELEGTDHEIDDGMVVRVLCLSDTSIGEPARYRLERMD